MASELKVSFICPVRDKASHVERTVLSILNQSYSPMEIVISDQLSTDGSRDIIRRTLDNYDGPNTVRMLTCEDTSHAGMAGLNNHLNFIDTQIEGDVVIMCSADDMNGPDRALLTVRAFEEYNPSYVNTGVCYTNTARDEFNYTDFPDRISRWLAPAETIEHQIGSNGSSAWARDLYQKHGPLHGCEQQDMILPMMALYERGIFYLDKYLHTYISHASLANAGVTGQVAAAKDEKHKMQLIEINNFIHVFNWTSIIGRWQESGAMEKVLADPLVFAALGEKLSNSAYLWATLRNDMIMQRIAPIQMNV